LSDDLVAIGNRVLKADEIPAEQRTKLQESILQALNGVRKGIHVFNFIKNTVFVINCFCLFNIFITCKLLTTIYCIDLHLSKRCYV